MNPFLRAKKACYTANIAMSVISNLSPLLFLTFRRLYGLSYSRLGFLVLINFGTQLCIDLIFSFFSHRFSIARTIRFTPILTMVGLAVYAAAPFLFPNNVFFGLLLGTVIFSASAGLDEVLISPVIAAIPAENPEREMSRLHSSYAWGVVGVVLFSTVFLRLFGDRSWQILALLWISVPLVTGILFLHAPIPKLVTPERASHVRAFLFSGGFLLFFFCMFCGGASEGSMSQWCSGYLEEALGIPKIWGDIFGVAMFSVMLGLGRTLYARHGKKIDRALLFGAAGAFLCYITAAFSFLPLLGLIACALTGFCVSMLWPGTLIVAADRFESAGVAVFALMAAGGDLGGSVGPQLVGSLTDAVLRSGGMAAFAAKIGLTAEQLGMKIGLFAAALFPLCAFLLLLIIFRGREKSKKIKAV